MAKINNTYSHDLEIKKLDKLKSAFSFQKDIEVGKIGEEYVKKILEGEAVKIEVKTDLWTLRTESQNLCLEYMSREKVSGIMKTEADFYAFVIGEIIILFPVPFLKFVCENCLINRQWLKDLGDNKTSKAVLIPWAEILNLYKEYKKK